MRLIGQGNTAEVYEYNQDTVLKLYKKGFSQKAITEELLISQMICAYGIKTPKPIEMITKDNRYGILFERIFGVSLLHLIRKMPFKIKKQSQILAVLHYKLHSQVAVGIEREQKAVLTADISKAPILSDVEKAQIINYLNELSVDNKLCHGDFHPDNILVNTDYWIIDWMTGMTGNPLGDVARTLTILTYGTMPQGTSKSVVFIVDLFRRKIKKEYITHYLKISGVEMSEIEKWILPVAAARLVESIPDSEKEMLIGEIRRRLQSID